MYANRIELSITAITSPEAVADRKDGHFLKGETRKEMKANELRIGNFVSFKEGLIRIEAGIDQFDISHFYWWEECNSGEEICDSIPLTEEWLLRFGWEEQTKSWDNARWFQFHSCVTWTFWMDTMAIYSS